METAVGDDKVGRFFLHQPCYHFRFQASSVNGTPHMSVSVADLLCSVWKDTANGRYRTLPYSYVFSFTYCARYIYSADKLIVHVGMHFRYGGDSCLCVVTTRQRSLASPRLREKRKALYNAYT